MNNEAKLRGLRERHRIRTAERIRREKATLDIFAENDRQIGKHLAQRLGVNILTVRRTIYRLRDAGHRIGAAKGYGYVYFGGPK